MIIGHRRWILNGKYQLGVLAGSFSLPGESHQGALPRDKAGGGDRGRNDRGTQRERRGKGRQLGDLDNFRILQARLRAGRSGLQKNQAGTLGSHGTVETYLI